MVPLSCSTRALSFLPRSPSVAIRARRLVRRPRRRGRRRRASLDTPTTTRPHAVRSQRPADAAKRSRSIYIVLAVLMGGGLVLFGIGGAGLSGGLVDAITGSTGSSTAATARYQKRVKQTLAETRAQPEGPDRLGRPRPRALPARERRRTTSTSRRGTCHGERQEASSPAPPRPGSSTSRCRQQARRRRRRPDGPGLQLGGPQPAAERGRRPGGHHRGAARRRRPSPTSRCSPTRRARPARATWPRRRRSSLSDKDLRANLKAQLDQAKQQSAAAAASSATPHARPPRLRRLPRRRSRAASSPLTSVPRPCSSTGRAADS